MTARAAATAPSRTGRERGAGVAASTGIQVTRRPASASAASVASASPRRIASASVGDAAAEAVDAVEHDDPADAACRPHRVRGPDDVAEHRAGLDRRRAGPGRRPASAAPPAAPPRRAAPSATARPSRSRRRSPRRAGAGCRGGGGSGCGCPGASRAAGAASRPRSAEQLRADARRSTSSAAASSWTASSQPRGGLAGRRGERDERLGAAAAAACSASSATIRATVVVLPVPGPAGDDREAAPHRGRGGQRAGARRPRRRTAARARGEDRPRRRVGRAGAERAQVRGDLALLAPVAVEVERGADQAQRTARASSSPTATSALAASRRDHAVGPATAAPPGRPAPRRRPSRSRGSSRDRRRRARAAARARRARRRARPLVVLAGERGEPPRDVHVGRREHAGLVERAQQPGGAARERGRRTDRPSIALTRAPPVEHVAERPTSAAGGRQANTPHGVPSTTGVSGPAMPRRNR